MNVVVEVYILVPVGIGRCFGFLARHAGGCGYSISITICFFFFV